MCKFIMHLKKSASLGNVKDQELFNFIKACVVPSFHSAAHKMSCQLKYNPRSVKFSGWQDYEGNERFWAIIDSLIKQTLHVFIYLFRWLGVEESIAYLLKLKVLTDILNKMCVIVHFIIADWILQKFRLMVVNNLSSKDSLLAYIENKFKIGTLVSSINNESSNNTVTDFDSFVTEIKQWKNKRKQLNIISNQI